MTEKPVECVEGLIVKPGAHGRRTYSRKAKRALVELCKAPGVSVAALALAHGINANLLRRWIDRYGGKSIVEAKRGTENRAALLPVKMVEPSAPAAVMVDGTIEISFRSATIRLSGVINARALATVLDCLAQRT
jgi:transposase